MPISHATEVSCVSRTKTRMSPRLLITGSHGFVGRHLLAALARDLPGATVHCSAFDLTDQPAIRNAVATLHPDACIHLAAVSTVATARARPDHAWQVNLTGTLELAWAIRDLAPDCTLIFVSSAEVYGASFAPGAPLDEHAVLAPQNTYAATKAAADLALGAMAAEGLKVIRLRPFNHTGPGQSDAFVVAAFARQLARIEAGLQSPELLTGSLSPQRDFLDVRDVCAAYVRCIERMDSIPSGTILNISSGVPRQIGAVLADLRALCRVDVAVRTDPARLRPVDIAIASGDSRRAESLLDWRPTIGWDQTLAEIMDDWRSRL